MIRYAFHLLRSCTWDDVIGVVAVLAMFWGLPWFAAFVAHVVTP